MALRIGHVTGPEMAKSISDWRSSEITINAQFVVVIVSNYPRLAFGLRFITSCRKHLAAQTS
jgi:hypothetical protein